MRTPSEIAAFVVFAVFAQSLSMAAPGPAQLIEHDVALPKEWTQKAAPEGYSVGNFGIAAAISADGLEITKSLINPPVLGQWLQPFGRGKLTLGVAGTGDFSVVDRYSVFPENSSQWLSKDTGVEAQVQTFAPLSASGHQGSFDSFIPAFIVRVRLVNRGDRSRFVSLDYSFTPENTQPRVQVASRSEIPKLAAEVHQAFGDSQVWLMSVADNDANLGRGQERSTDSGNLTRALTVRLEPRQQRNIAFVIGAYDSRGYTSSRFASRDALEKYIVDGLGRGAEFPSGKLPKEYAQFLSGLPRTGDSELDVYARWYLSAAVLLTKGIRSGEVLTMGYKELNQRDSFWTSGAHLVFWPDLELKMLEESMASQLPNGQIPMTILPTIIRDYNIDGNEYFILRVARYYRWRKDASFLRQALPTVKRAIEYLIALDTDHIGMPKQVSYWADWKDVPGAEGRIYAPHFDLLWLAALKEARYLASEAADPAFASRMDSLYQTAYERVNRDVADGGLWDQTRYVDVWKDGRSTPYTLHDQTLAAIFDVIPRSRLDKIYSQLNNSNETTFGVRETYPYIQSFAQSYGAGEYHNGGIWPYINCADAWGRFKNGHSEDAVRIIKKVGYNGLVRTNEYTPGEFLNGDTGKNTGFKIQGWDAACFSAIYFGALGIESPSVQREARVQR